VTRPRLGLAVLPGGNNRSEQGGDQPHSHEPAPEPERSGLTGYAIAKYGIILIIVVVVLWFVANHFLGD
jgi:hypothetical protein